MSNANKKNLSILLCEDDPNLGQLLSSYLRVKGYDIVWAQDGVEGLKAFHRGTFDFVILDVMMPIKDGYQVAEEIRRESRHLPILFLTARSSEEDTIEGFKVGADDYMTKPFSMEELVLRIQAILRRSAALPEPGEEVVHFQIGTFDYDYNNQTLHHLSGALIDNLFFLGIAQFLKRALLLGSGRRRGSFRSTFVSADRFYD